MYRLQASISVVVLCSIASLLTAPPILAQAFTITCQAASCQMTPPDTALFQVTNLTPGETTSGSFLIENKQKKEGCELKLFAARSTERTDPDLATQLTLQLSDQFWTYGAGLTFAELFEKTDGLSIGIIDPQKSSIYTWKTHFAAAANNTFQAATLSYNFDLHFSCDAELRAPVPPTATPMPTKTPRPTEKPGGPRPTPPATPPLTPPLPSLPPRPFRPQPPFRPVQREIGSVLGEATTSASLAPAKTIPLSVPSANPPTEKLSLPTKIGILIFCYLSGISLLWLFFLILFRRKRKKEQNPH